MARMSLQTVNSPEIPSALTIVARALKDEAY